LFSFTHRPLGHPSARHLHCLQPTDKVYFNRQFADNETDALKNPHEFRFHIIQPGSGKEHRPAAVLQVDYTKADWGIPQDNSAQACNRYSHL
jgi:hypothetical protein